MLGEAPTAPATPWPWAMAGRGTGLEGVSSPSTKSHLSLTLPRSSGWEGLKAVSTTATLGSQARRRAKTSAQG